MNFGLGIKPFRVGSIWSTLFAHKILFPSNYEHAFHEMESIGNRPYCSKPIKKIDIPYEFIPQCKSYKLQSIPVYMIMIHVVTLDLFMSVF